MRAGIALGLIFSGFCACGGAVHSAPDSTDNTDNDADNALDGGVEEPAPVLPPNVDAIADEGAFTAIAWGEPQLFIAEYVDDNGVAGAGTKIFASTTPGAPVVTGASIGEPVALAVPFGGATSTPGIFWIESGNYRTNNGPTIALATGLVGNAMMVTIGAIGVEISSSSGNCIALLSEADEALKPVCTPGYSFEPMRMNGNGFSILPPIGKEAIFSADAENLYYSDIASFAHSTPLDPTYFAGCAAANGCVSDVGASRNGATIYVAGPNGIHAYVPATSTWTEILASTPVVQIGVVSDALVYLTADGTLERTSLDADAGVATTIATSVFTQSRFVFNLAGSVVYWITSDQQRVMHATL